MAVRRMLSQPMISNTTLEILFANKEKYTSSLKLQRNNAWNFYQKSNLINSLLTDYPIPQIIVNIVDGKFHVADGGNRLRAVFEFMDNQFPISEGIEDISDGNEVYKIEGLYFKDFSDRLRNIFITKTLEIKFYTGLDEEQEAEIILRSNSGTEMTKIEKARVQNHKNGIQDFVMMVTNTDLFERKVNIIKSKKDKFLHEQVIYNLLALECGIDDIGVSNYEKLGKEIDRSEILTGDKKSEILSIILYMNEVFPAKQKYLTNNNFIPIYMVCKEFSYIKAREMYSYIDGFFSVKNEEYENKTSKWNSNSVISKRYEILKQYVQNVLNDKESAE